ncbi:hypothetical protein PX52LOC_05691 [Limnoglobus roseus]|uniref:Uncharacterized protein n=1 Tax=Limnoglobus roseus TaxID=2598579 RepID=A0A5C1AKG8_9BACT|nr:hypothetical protein PX52LOC_05691 [Limnoglobus roseus]
MTTLTDLSVLLRLCETESSVALWESWVDTAKHLLDMSTDRSHLISRETAARSLDAWLRYWELFGRVLSPPAVCTGPDGVLTLSWDRGEWHIAWEFRPEIPPTFFYRNRQTGEANVGEIPWLADRLAEVRAVL